MIASRVFTMGFLLLTIIMGRGHSDAETPSKAFWTWFVKNEDRLAGALKSDPVAAIAEIKEHLHAHKGLVAEAAMANGASTTPTLVISADGKSEYFDAVKTLVAAAPTLQRWHVVAFRPRRVDAPQLDIAGKTFDVRDFSFRARRRKDERRLDVQIFAHKMSGAVDRPFNHAVYLFLDFIIGEYDVETKLGVIEIVPTPAKPPAELRPLTELAKVVDSL